MKANNTPLRVAIVDDNKGRRDTLSFTLEDAGLTPVPIEGTTSLDLDEAVRIIHDSADAAVCDHRLSKNGYATFSGAELVAALYSSGVPAILITAFQDDDLSISSYRQYIPRLLVGDEISDSELLTVAVAAAVDEVVAKRVPEDRRTHQSFVRIDNIVNEAGREVVYAFIPQWSGEVGIKFPFDLIPLEIRKSVTQGDKLLAEVNTGAADRKDVFLTDFATSPEPAEDDDLA